ncbi:hypothetical protein [Fibrobacter sp. UWEL]|uniref:hypothetical protein n=1 Tax=Fibrobacter sp. UWEL TaxID=1896209 RepID=UPI00091BB0A8|nr:hypothetical protein [Fibrobacter sp. UWEL]SHL34396.1 hypothetical protein SAMN05720468_1234 [Fibrobacter sp. UWEL]
MATSKVYSVSVPEELVPVVEEIKTRKDGLSGWFQEKVKQDSSAGDLDVVESTLKEVNEKMEFVVRALARMKAAEKQESVASKFNFDDNETFE